MKLDVWIIIRQNPPFGQKDGSGPGDLRHGDMEGQPATMHLEHRWV
jgi:hypothetical protein